LALLSEKKRLKKALLSSLAVFFGSFWLVKLLFSLKAITANEDI